MKNLIKLLLISSAAFGAFQFFGPHLNAFGSKNNYEVKWQGGTGQQLYGSYVIAELDGKNPMRVEKVEASLPHTVKFSAPKNAIVSAVGMSSSGIVTVAIHKNGLKCDQPAFEGSGAIPNKVCQ